MTGAKVVPAFQREACNIS